MNKYKCVKKKIRVGNIYSLSNVCEPTMWFRHRAETWKKEADMVPVLMGQTKIYPHNELKQ